MYMESRFIFAFPISLKSSYPWFLLLSETEVEHLVKGNGSYRDSSLITIN